MKLSAPAFWGGRGLLSLTLAPLGAAYGAITGRRMRQRPEADVPVPVICVGNFVMGGAGKTPVAMALAAIARREKLAPVVLSRGYGGRLRGPLVVDPAAYTAADVGDEPLIIARETQTVVARDRVAGAIAVARAGAGLIILDDGFQNPSLRRDMNLVVVDAGYGIGNGRTFPAGPLRAPMASQLAATGALVVVGRGTAAAGVARAVARRRRPILHGRIEVLNPTDLRGRRLLLFVGIARPEKVAATLADTGAEVAGVMAFGDHHPYDEDDATRILREARRLEAGIATTEKDLARLAAQSGALRDLREAAIAIRVRFVFDDEADVVRLLDETREHCRRRMLRAAQSNDIGA